MKSALSKLNKIGAAYRDMHAKAKAPKPSKPEPEAHMEGAEGESPAEEAAESPAEEAQEQKTGKELPPKIKGKRK